MLNLTLTTVHSSNAQRVGKALCERLKENIKRYVCVSLRVSGPEFTLEFRQLFDVAIQSMFEGRVMAREK